MLVTLASFREPQEAHMLRGRLRAEGIFAVVSFAYHVGNDWAYSTALNGVKLQVRRADLDAARSVLSLCRADEYTRQLRSELGDLNDRHCPNCGAADYWKRRPLYQGALAVTLVFSFVGFLPPWRWLYFCNVCGTKFRSQYGLIGKARAAPPLSMDFMQAGLPDLPEMQDLLEFVSAGRSVADKAEIVPSERRPAWLCRMDGMLAGFSLVDEDAGTLAALCVLPDLERNGIGRQLHDSAVDWLFAKGVPIARTTARPWTRAHRLLNAAGWTLEDIEPNGDHRLILDAAVWRARRAKF